MEIRKLKRGLKDVSPLFGIVEEPIASPAIVSPCLETPGRRLEILNVFSVDHPEESLFHNTYLASRISGIHFPSCVISIKPSYGVDSHAKKAEDMGPSKSDLKHLSLSWEEFEKIIVRPIPNEYFQNPPAQSLFLDFNYYKIPHPEKMISILDKWVLIMRPTSESLTETYKMIKAAQPVNPHLEYFIFMDEESAEPVNPSFFEQFSELAAKHLGISLVWLGGFSLAHPPAASLAPNRFEFLFLNAGSEIPSPAKISLAQCVQSFRHPAVRHAG
ncbi:MAG: hypothetical protein HYZ83_02750 [Candidatus Omnitrophica bacterium]|nr:hypothetical protein [Candidatus Omnitrophota bacterium]